MNEEIVSDSDHIGSGESEDMMCAFYIEGDFVDTEPEDTCFTW